MRLTEKFGNDHYRLLPKFREKSFIASDKLGELENIEEEFEIDSVEDLRDRLTTYKFIANHEMSCVDVNAYNLMLEDLSKYHTFEEKFGIDLVILHKALENGIWVKTKNGISKHLTVALKKRHHTKEYWLFYRPYSHVYLKDYGKTWALKRKELL